MYREIIVKKKGIFSKEEKQIEFACMQPYAAIRGEKEHTSALDKINPIKLMDAVMKDAAESLTTTLGDKCNIKVFKYKKYECINAAGREFSTYLLDIPAQLVRSDGKISEVYKDDEQYELLGETIAPAIEMIPALEIIEAHTDRPLIFYGRGIHLNDVLTEYDRLKRAVVDFQNVKELDERNRKNEEKNLEAKKTQGFLGNILSLTFHQNEKNIQQEQMEKEITEKSSDDTKKEFSKVRE